MFTLSCSWRRAILLTTLVTAAIFSTATRSQAASLYYWDTNGSNTGAGSIPDGTWGEDTNWNYNETGNGDPAGWVEDEHAVFAAGGDATGAYTVTVDGTRAVSDIHFDDGAPTLTGGTLALANDKRLISAAPGITATINTVLASKSPGGVTNLTKYKLGTLILGGNNTYSGETQIEGGILQLGASDRIPDTSNLILANGGTDGINDTPATFHTGGFNETLGMLKLTGPNASIARTIDFGHGASSLVFVNSSGEEWNGIPLTIVNFTPGVDSLRFGTDNTGLNNTQLVSIVFADFGNTAGIIDANGFVSPAGPILTEVTGAGTANTVISWTANDGSNYQVQYKQNLNDATWNDLGSTVTAFGTTASVNDDTSSGGERYYRVLLLP